MRLWREANLLCSFYMGMISTLVALCERNAPVTSGFPHKGPVKENFDIFVVNLKNFWSNIRVAGN